MFKSSGDPKRWVSLVLIVVIAVAVGMSVRTRTAEKVGPAVGNKAPDFTLQNLASKNVQLAQVINKNKVTLVNFWGIWCPYCVREIPEIVKFYNRYHQRGVEVLALDVGDNPNQVSAFAKKNQMTFPVLIDKNEAVSKRYQVSGFPTTFIIDRNGKIKDVIVGATNQATLTTKVEAVLKEG